jgi:hypothetical protein
MSEEAIAGAALAEPQTEARDVIATCRSAWGAVHASQSEGGEVDSPALTIYIASCERLEELGYSVEGRPAEMEIMLIEDGAPSGGDVMVGPAVFLDLGPVPLNELAVVMDVRPVAAGAGAKSVLCVGAAQGQGGQPVVEDLWWDGCAFPPRSYLLWTSPAAPSCAGDAGKVPAFTTDTAACSSEYGLGFFECLSDSHVVCHSAIAGKSPGETMASAFILAKTSRSPLKKLRGRLIPTAAIGNGDRPPSPQGEGGHPGQDMLPPSPGHGGSDHESFERGEGLNSPPLSSGTRAKNSTTASRSSAGWPRLRV